MSKAKTPPKRPFLDRLFDKPYLLIIAGFIILVSVWVFFFVAASRNQPTIILEPSMIKGLFYGR